MTNLESGQRTSPFLSYCWDDLDMAYMLEALLAAKGVELIWDKRCLKLDDSISQFMSLGCDCSEVILLVSNSYLKSQSCMKEVLEVLNGSEPLQRIKPLILPSAHIFSPEGRAGYVQYWAGEYEHLQKEIRKIGRGAAAGSLNQDLVLLNQIYENADHFLSMLADRYSPTELLEFVEHFCAGRQQQGCISRPSYPLTAPGGISLRS